MTLVGVTNVYFLVFESFQIFKGGLRVSIFYCLDPPLGFKRFGHENRWEGTE